MIRVSKIAHAAYETPDLAQQTEYFTATSVYAALFEASGIPYAQLLDRLECALPEPLRSSAHSAARQAMIRHWWPPERKAANFAAGKTAAA